MMIFLKIIEIFFWTSVCVLAYTYVLYPVVLIAMRFVLRRTEHSGTTPTQEWPPISIVFAVHNEEKNIVERVNNLLSSSYPADRVEILVGSDGSDDGTEKLLRAMVVPNLRVWYYPKQRGKAAVLNDLVAAASGKVIVFTDANTHFDRDTIRLLVEPLSDPRIGGVCGRLHLHTGTGQGIHDGETSYWTYENLLKQLESDIKTTLGATGAVYALRKALFRPIPTDRLIVDDLLIPLSVLEQGGVVKYEGRAMAYEPSAGSVRSEFRRRVRIGAANFFTLSEFRSLLNPKNGFVAFALWSHKIIRWIAPLLLLVMFCATVGLSTTSAWYQLILLTELVFLALAGLGMLGEKKGMTPGILNMPYYFIAMNLALLLGLIKYLLGDRRPHWEVIR